MHYLLVRSLFLNNILYIVTQIRSTSDQMLPLLLRQVKVCIKPCPTRLLQLVVTEKWKLNWKIQSKGSIIDLDLSISTLQIQSGKTDQNFDLFRLHCVWFSTFCPINVNIHIKIYYWTSNDVKKNSVHGVDNVSNVLL